MALQMQCISRAAAARLPSTVRHGAHAMLYGEVGSDNWVMKRNSPPQSILTVMRFDGKLGFPWAFGEGSESYEEIMNRALSELLNINKHELLIRDRDYHQSSYSEGRSVCLHFYTKRISKELFQKIEKEFTPNHTDMILGLVRCPLYILGNGFYGLPAFLHNNFVGDSKELLINGIRDCKLLTESQMKSVLNRHDFDLDFIVD